MEAAAEKAEKARKAAETRASQAGEELARLRSQLDISISSYQTDLTHAQQQRDSEKQVYLAEKQRLESSLQAVQAELAAHQQRSKAELQDKESSAQVS
jgi:hypothetical protein